MIRAYLRSVPLLAGCAASLLGQRADSSARDSVSLAKRRLPTVVVTGTLSQLAPEKAGVARSTLTHDQLRTEPARSMIDPLRHTTGIYIDEATGPLGPAIIRVRGGEETFTQVSVDGVPINENGGYFDAEGLTLVNIDRVEVARGPQSAVYGSSAMSGVVQLFTRAGEYGPMRAEASASAGRATTNGANARASLEAWGGTARTRYSFGIGSGYDRGVYRLPNDLRANDASLRYDVLPSAALALSAVARYSTVDAHLPVRDLGVTRAPLDPNSRQRRDRTLAALDGIWTPSDRWTHRVSASMYQRDFLYEDKKDGLDPTQFSTFVFDANFHYTAVVRRAMARYVGNVTAHADPTTRLSFSYGSEWGRETLDDKQTGDYGAATSSPARGNIAAFGEAQVGLGRLSLLIGSRVEKFGNLKATAVPRATAVVEAIPRRLNLRAALSRAYKAPNIQDQYPNNPFIVANPDLKPETSRNWEVGADFTTTMWLTSASLTWFSQDYANLIRSVNFDTTGKQINRNLGSSRASGLEVEVVAHPRARWDLGASGAWTKTRILANGGLPVSEFPVGATLPFRPDYTATAFVGIPATRSISVVARATAIGRQTALENRFSGARVSIAPFHTIGATGTWLVSPSADVYLQMENALDAKYNVAVDRPGNSRSLAVGVRLRR